MRTRVASGILALVVGACSGSQSASSTSAPSTTMPPSQTTSTSDGGVEGYLDLLDRLLSQAGFAVTVDEAEELFVSVGERMCRLLDLGLAVEDLLVVSLVTAGALEEDAESSVLGGIVLGAAVAELCPGHLERLGSAG
jgi:hypothetical protein